MKLDPTKLERAANALLNAQNNYTYTLKGFRRLPAWWRKRELKIAQATIEAYLKDYEND